MSTNSAFGNHPLGTAPQPRSVTTKNLIGAVPTAVDAYVSAKHSVLGYVVQTDLTITNLPMSVASATRFQGKQIFTFPFGLIQFKNAKGAMIQKTTSVIASTINAGVTGAWSVGSAVAASTTLNGTAANLVPSVAFASSTVIDTAGAETTGKLDSNDDLGEAFSLDGQTTQLGLWFNDAYPTATDVDADGTETWSGLISVIWELYKFPQGSTF